MKRSFEQLYERDSDSDMNTASNSSTSSVAECNHQTVEEDPEQPSFVRCACNAVRYAVCHWCNRKIDLSGTDLRWPHCCVSCKLAACIRCANKMKRADEEHDDAEETAIVCRRCDPKPGPSRLWCAALQVSHVDRERRPHNEHLVVPYTHLARDEAAQAALDYFALLYNLPVTDDIVESLAQKMQQKHDGWFYADNIKFNHSTYLVCVGLYAMHAPSVETLRLPEL